MKALFLDRDGIINRERGDYTWLPEQFVFTENLFPFLKKMMAEGYVVVVITNQGGIAKEIYEKGDPLNGSPIVDIDFDAVTVQEGEGTRTFRSGTRRP